MHTLAYISHPACKKHEMFESHPESPQRLDAIKAQLINDNLYDLLLHKEANLVTHEQLQRVHSLEHINMIHAMSPTDGLAGIDGDTYMNPHTMNAAKYAAGAVVMATEMVMTGQVKSAFCNVRPPGHHAERKKAMGFCFFNNIAVGAAHALTHFGLNKIAIIDFDVHHGNGTEDIFKDDPRVMLCSLFQHPFYPYSQLTERNNIIHAPLAANSGSKQFQQAFLKQCLPALEQFHPQLVYISAGFDAHHADNISNLNIYESDYAWITHKIKELAMHSASGKIISVLEGGYNLEALGKSASSHLNVLMQP